MNSTKFMEKLGYEISEVPVDKNGLVDPENVRKAIRPDTILVSISCMPTVRLERSNR